MNSQSTFNFKVEPKFLRNLILLAGVGVSWSEVLFAFARFYRNEGTFFKIKDCALPNPVTTPCFWGALAFAGALVWSYKLARKQNPRSEKFLLYFLAGAVIFAWSNFAIELAGVKPTPGAIVAPCPANAGGPFVSACFFGSILFTLACAVSYYVNRQRPHK